MKLKVVFFVAAIACLALTHCKDDKVVSYPSENVVFDNAEASTYFHTIFLEVERGWAWLDSVEYMSIDETWTDGPSRNKTYAYDDVNGVLTLTYNPAWIVNGNTLDGKIEGSVMLNSYHKNNVKITNIMIPEFSINGQNITGGSGSSITYTGTGNVVEDGATVLHKYDFKFSSADIHEKGVNKPIIINSSVTWQYELAEGGDTDSFFDNVWKCTGIMTGRLQDNPGFSYTNTITSPVFFTLGCKTARQGMSTVKMQDKELLFEYNCTDIQYQGVPVTDRK